MARVCWAEEQRIVSAQVFHKQLEKFTARSSKVDGPFWSSNVICEFHAYGALCTKILSFDCTAGAVPDV